MSATIGWVRTQSEAARAREARSWRGRLKRAAGWMAALFALVTAIAALTLLVRLVWNWGGAL